MGRKYSVTYLHDRLRKQFRSGEEPVRVSTYAYVSRNVSFSRKENGSKRDENIHSLRGGEKERDEIKSYTVIAVFFSGGSRAYTSGVLAPAISRLTLLSPCLSLFPLPPPPLPPFPLCPKDSGGRDPCNTTFRKTYYSLISPFCLSKRKTMPPG